MKRYDFPEVEGGSLREIIATMVDTALQRCLEEDVFTVEDVGGWVVEVPKRPEHGDYSTNAAMVLARRTSKNPREIAQGIVERLEETHHNLERVEIQPPGFINFFLSRRALVDSLREILGRGEAYGRSRMGAEERVQVEFVSANPTGPLHIGHGRGAAVGDALAGILEAAGYRVCREYYVNDVGRQMETLGRSVWLRYLQELGRDVDFPQDHYRGDYIRGLAREVLRLDGAKWADLPEEEALPRLTDYAQSAILDGIRADLEAFRVHYDRWFRESSLYEEGRVRGVLDELREKDLVYEHEGALWFRSSAFGDEKDRVTVRSDGRTTYFASDISYHADKFRRGFEKVIDIWGADHHGYVPRMKGVIKALGRDPQALQVLLVQMVNLLRGGEPMAMSTRSGEFATLREVIDEVGVDAARYIFLMRSPDSHLDFDLEVAKRQERENPVYYVQYAHARICSILKEAKERGVAAPGPDDGDLSLLRLPEEWNLIKDLGLYPDVIEQSARRLEPHRLTFFLDSLAADFHAYYNKGWLDPKVRVITDDVETTRARLLLVLAIRVVLRNALGLLGVTAPEKM
jgi:arginyl-tRNA synthetase